MKLKYVLWTALCCSVINFVVQCSSIFLLNGEEFMTVFGCERIRSLSLSNLNAWFGNLGILATIFFIIFLLKMQKYIKPKIVTKTLVVLECIAVLYSALFLIPELHITILYGGQHIVGDWDYWEKTGRNIAPLLYDILFDNHLYASLYFGHTMNVVQGIFNMIIDPLANLLLIVLFFRMKNLMPLTRIISIMACLLPVIHRVMVLSGVNVYAPMINQTYFVVNGVLWCTMLLLLCMNSDLLEENVSH